MAVLARRVAMTGPRECFIMHNAGEAARGGPLVLVTGASGKIGKHVVREAIRQGFKVRALTSRPRVGGDVLEGLVEWRVKDFTRSIDFDEDVEGRDAIIHLAAEIADKARMQRVNVETTSVLARASERAGVAVFCCFFVVLGGLPTV
jgi:nucleoside-diphosphate-sugar epimerase